MIQPLPPCPGKGDVVRRYEVAAVQTKLVYNRYGDHDPDGLIFVPLEDVDCVREGKYKPKPLILRANVGDWLEVTLYNALDPDCPVPYFDYPRVPLEWKHKPSNRVSLNPQFLQYDPVCDLGINVGYNQKEQTVGIGRVSVICGKQTVSMVPAFYSPLEICEIIDIMDCLEQ